MIDITDFWPFLVAFSGLVAAGIGVPIPEELPIVGAGIWVAGDPAVGPWKWLILPVCILGVVISDGLLYGIGRWCGPALLERRWVRRILSAEKQVRIEKNFHDYGVKILLFARVLPGIRSPIFIMAGIMRLPLKRFIFADGIYAIPGVSLLFFLSYWFTDQFRDLIVAFEKKVDHARPIIILLILLGVGVYLVLHFWRKPVSTGDPKELPPILDKVAEKFAPPIGKELGNSMPPAPVANDQPPAGASTSSCRPVLQTGPDEPKAGLQNRPTRAEEEPPPKRAEMA